MRAPDLLRAQTPDRCSVRASLLLGLLVASCAVETLPAADPAPGAGTKPRIGLEKRVPWTTSKLTGSPEPPPPYRVVRRFPNLAFKQPVAVATAPGLDRMFVVELRGRIVSFPAGTQDVAETDLFVDLAQLQPAARRVYGLAFHPRFAENREVFVCYVLEEGNPTGTKVSRFKVTDLDPPRCDPKSETVLLEWHSGGHNGGCLEFGPDGLLYVTTGDGSSPSPPDTKDTGQDLSDLLASLLRIDVDRAEGGKPYAIPKDNPFVDVPGARPEIWAYGLRNPWKMCFDPFDGTLWVADVGWEMWEMVYRIERGGNYGWSLVEGSQLVRPEAKRGPTPVIPPVVQHDHTEARSITGGYVSRGQRLAELKGAYVYADYVTGKVWGLRHDGRRTTWKQELVDTPYQIVAFGEDPQGELYLVDYNAGTLLGLEKNDDRAANAAFPRKLSETGLFSDVASLTPAPGVLPYGIRAEPWSDHATAERWFALPGAPKMGRYEKDDLQLGHLRGQWIYPSDAVLAKTLSLELERGRPASRRRIETQILHRDGDQWNAYTFAWNDAQTDAVLVPSAGTDRTFAVVDKDAPGGRRTQTWHFASRTECIVCHTTRAGSVHGFVPPQLDREFDYSGIGGRSGDQLDTLAALGFFDLPPLGPKETERPRFPDLHDATLPLDQRARAYLHVNCGHCHRQGGGGTANFQLRYDLDPAKQNLIDRRPTQGMFGLLDGRTVAAGDPARSVLLYRMAKLGRGRMPYAGSALVDEEGLRLVRDWIAALPPDAKMPPPHKGVATARQDETAALDSLRKQGDRVDAAAVARLLSTTSGALAASLALADGTLPESVRTALVEAAAVHPEAAVRDLFERFLPEERRTKRLGTSINPEVLIALKGDARRGRVLFRESKTLQCRNCHVLEKIGRELGPDLAETVRKADRAKLVESLLEPSKTIDPKFVAWVAETVQGKVHVGLLVERGEKEVVLKDVEHRLIRIPAQDVEQLVPQTRSLMPDLLLRDMTAEEAADLLAYLESLR